MHCEEGGGGGKQDRDSGYRGDLTQLSDPPTPHPPAHIPASSATYRLSVLQRPGSQCLCVWGEINSTCFMELVSELNGDNTRQVLNTMPQTVNVPSRVAIIIMLEGVGFACVERRGRLSLV